MKKSLYIFNIYLQFFTLLIATTLFGGGCSSQETILHDRLSTYGLFKNITKLQPTDSSYTYKLNAPLFSDYTLKKRIIHLPEGESAQYKDSEVFDFPVGSIISKTFSIASDLRQPQQNIKYIETRLLIHQPNGWEGISYKWNDTQDEATKKTGGSLVTFDFIDPSGTPQRTESYLIPAAQECQTCHHVLDNNKKQIILPIGPEARNLNLEKNGVNQLTEMKNRKLLRGLSPSPPRLVKFDDKNEPIDQRARAYLHGNCAHCHNPRGTNGINSQLFLNIENDMEFNLGFCKRPGSAGAGGAGRTFDIVPGNAEASILWYRTSLTDGGLMPPLARSLVHTEGLAIIREWINALPPNNCSVM